MGSGVSTLLPCFKPPQPPSSSADDHRRPPAAADHHHQQQQQLVYSASELLSEETAALGHSFCYVPSSSNRFLSPTPSDRFLSPTSSARFSPSQPDPNPNPNTTIFRTISGASVSANTSTPRAVDGVYDDATGGSSVVNVVGGGLFESTASFCALPLQPVPRGGDGFFLSGPMERGALSGPLDSILGGGSGRVNFSAPLGGVYVKKKRKRKGVLGLKKAAYQDLLEKKRPWVVPVFNLVSRRDNSGRGEEGKERCEDESSSNVQWALGKAGEDRVHVVVSEEQGWLFVGIYDGFNGPDAPEFLMGHLYKAVYKELQGLFWEIEEPEEVQDVEQIGNSTNPIGDNAGEGEVKLVPEVEENAAMEAGVRKDGSDSVGEIESSSMPQGKAKRVTFQSEGTEIVRRRRLWELLAEAEAEDGLDLSGSARFAFSVDDAITVSNAGSAGSRRWLLLSKLKQGLSKHKERKLFAWKFGLDGKEEKVENAENVEGSRVVEGTVLKRKRKVGPVDHELVLSALSRALELTELAYLDMTDKLIDTNPELALMGSCLLVVLMRDEHVYVMNLGDSRAIVAQYEPREIVWRVDDNGESTEGIIEGSTQAMRLTALQLSTDHSTSIEEEVMRIKNEHPDDSQCIVNDRVKGRLKVTRAFGAGSLKQPKWNDSLLEMFRNEFIGSAPYISCSPSLCHHQLCPRDQFLVLSSDGLYQYLTNQEVVSHVENFLERFPEGDPAQHLIEELLSRAAKKAGMDFHELLDIPQGDRRKYHDDVTVMVISLEGRIWKSSGKYP